MTVFSIGSMTMPRGLRSPSCTVVMIKDSFSVLMIDTATMKDVVIWCGSSLPRSWNFIKNN